MNVKKHVIICSAIGISICCVSLFAMLPITGSKANVEGSSWMKDIKDETPLTTISMPGSHDSGALHSIGDLSGKCQDLSIMDQLKAGSRFFDMRLQLRNGVFKVVHGIVDQKLNFSSVLNDFKSFLKDNPTEGLIVTVKEDNDPVNTDKNFDDSLKETLSEYSDIWNVDREMPSTLGELRGKIYLVSRYKDSTIGLPAHQGWIEHDVSATTNSFDIERINLHVQDYFKLKDVENKKKEIKNCFDYSASNTGKLTLNFTSSYYVDGFPPTYAGTTAKIINSWVIEEVKNRKNLGITISDFLTSELCKAIYMRNF